MELSEYLKKKYKSGFGLIVFLTHLGFTAWIALLLCEKKKNRFSFKNRPAVYLFDNIPLGDGLFWGIYFIIIGILILCFIPRGGENGIFTLLYFIFLPMLIMGIFILSYTLTYKAKVRYAQKIIDLANSNSWGFKLGHVYGYLRIPEQMRNKENLVLSLISSLDECGIINYEYKKGVCKLKIIVPELVENRQPVILEGEVLIECPFCGATNQIGKCAYCDSELL